ncbi:CGNR zinc finger domain-containing protein [Mycetocola lacteus]|uniref:CGNR zinc finger domain-containing protein n=1 Tax=Mycetocola lacteus TaxID=76637 RepID=A0A3L7AT40_9MICO|nr:CGNR zinc finger domain-containing protein [Mycetocola lacteus]RLP83294.1 CGNR zinc finger domain-containing protein [Mycetocola lacteus]
MGTTSERYGVITGPDDAGAIQDLLNTFANGRSGKPDLLAADDVAAHWWSERFGSLGLAQNGVPGGSSRLRALRDALRAALTEGGVVPGVETAAEVSGGDVRTVLDMSLRADGTVAPTPAGTGWDAALAEVLLWAYRSQLQGTWPRLKVCRNPECEVAFYDRSRNSSGVWHDALVCGNVANLRASRARKRERAEVAASESGN